MKKDKDTIERLRCELPIIRTIAGWSAKELADLLEVSRITIVNLENKKEGKMSVIQYLAIRKLFDEEIKENKNDQLQKAIDFLVDRDDVMESERESFREKCQAVAKKVGRRAGSAAIGKALADLRLSDISPDTIEKGKTILERVLSESTSTNNSGSKGGEKFETLA